MTQAAGFPPGTYDVRRDLRERGTGAPESDRAAAWLVELAQTEGEPRALVELVGPWLTPFADSETLARLLATADDPISVSTPQRNARILLQHLLHQDLDYLLAERKILLESLAESLAYLEQPVARRALRNALTYPFITGTSRADVLVELAKVIGSKELLSEEDEGELSEVYRAIIHSPDSSKHAKGAAADQLGLMLKNTRHLPPHVSGPMALSYMRLSLDYFDRDSDRLDWATVHNNIGNLLSQSSGGVRGAAILQAIDEYKLAKEAITEKDAPDLLAAICDNLAIALARNPYGSKSENLSTALQESGNALRIWTFTSQPVDRLKASFNYLNIAYRLVSLYVSEGTLAAHREEITSSVRDALDPLDAYMEHARYEVRFTPTSVHLGVAERLAGLLPSLNADLQLGIHEPARRWLLRAQWIDERLRSEGVDLGASARLAEALTATGGSA